MIAFGIAVFVGIAVITYLAVSAHWRCDELQRWREEVDPPQTGRHSYVGEPK